MKRIIKGDYIYTADREGNFYSPGIIVVEDELITWVGPEAEYPLGTGTNNFEVIDVGENIIIPGLINCHAHSGMNGLRGMCDNGDLSEWAKSLAPYTSVLNEQDMRWGSYTSVMEMVQSGTTCVCDCTRYGIGILPEATMTIGMRSLSGALANSPEYRKVGKPNWDISLKETIEAQAAFGKTGLARFFLGAHSPYNCTPDLLLEVKGKAIELGLPFNIHVAETRAEVEIIRERHGMRPVEWLAHLNILDEQTILDHCVWLDDREIDLISAARCGVVHCPVSNAKLASGIAPVSKFLANKVKVGLGTDSAVSNNSLDLFGEMKMAMLVARLRDNERFLEPEQVVRMVTSAAAEVLGMGDEIGSIETGKRADLVFINHFHPQGYNKERVLSDLVFSTGPQHVKAVMVNGKLVYQKGTFLLMDQEELLYNIKTHFKKGV